MAVAPTRRAQQQQTAEIGDRLRCDKKGSRPSMCGRPAAGSYRWFRLCSWYCPTMACLASCSASSAAS
jgi:hypothetical protein